MCSNYVTCFNSWEHDPARQIFVSLAVGCMLCLLVCMQYMCVYEYFVFIFIKEKWRDENKRMNYR